MKKVIFDKAAAILVVMAMLASPVPAMAEDGLHAGNDEQQNEMTADNFAPNETEEETIEDGTAEGEEPATHPVTDVRAKSYSFDSITISWKGEADTFKVLRKSGDSWVKVGETCGSEFTDTGLKPGGRYTYRVDTDVSSGEVSAVVINSKTAKLSMVSKGGKRFDVRIAAGQPMYGYDTVQGACSYKGYAYFALYNRKKERIKIAKVNLGTMKVVKVSKPLKSRCHGNTLTYNPRTNRIIACCGKGGKTKIAVINASTLKQSYTKSFKISSRFIGGKYKGVSALAYNREKDIYVMKLSGNENKIVLLDRNFKLKKYARIQGNRSYLLPQGLYSEGEYMYDVQSFKGKHKYNMITVRRLNGSLVGRITVPSGTSGQLFELENIFFEGDKWYVSFYRAHVRKKGDRDRKNYLYVAKW